LRFAFVTIGEPVEVRRDGVARAAPLRPEVDDDRNVRREDLVTKCRVGDVEDVGSGHMWSPIEVYVTAARRVAVARSSGCGGGRRPNSDDLRRRCALAAPARRRPSARTWRRPYAARGRDGAWRGAARPGDRRGRLPA